MAEELVNTFREFVERERLFTKEDRLLLACSGGVDSTVLAHLLYAEGYQFELAHMNFQLRGEASDQDAAFVEDLARTLCATFWYKAVDVKGQAQPGESTQMTARRLRYDWFEGFMLEQQHDYLLTGHHANDNLETFFINLLRGTGIRGVAGMAPKRNWFCHPLLTVSRKALVKYAKEANIKWREDASNATDDYLRNRIRHHLVPVLTDNFDYNLERWVTTADNLRSDLFLRDYGLAQLKKEYVRTIGDYTILDRFKIDIPAIFRVLLYELGKQSNFTPEQIRQMGVASGNKQFDSISDCAFVTPTEISFAYRGIVRDEPLASLAIDTFPFAVADGTGRRIFLTAEDKPSQLNHEKALYLAPTPLPLHLRPRQAGDRFQPLGLGGKSKKVKDYMIDQKIPVWLRDQIYLLVNEQNEIMAIPGYCISEKFKVLPEHEQVLCISWA